VAGEYHIFLGNYTECVPVESTDLKTRTASSKDGFPTSLKHGSVTQIMQAKLDAIRAKYVA
jgi:hypothetical protein